MCSNEYTTTRGVVNKYQFRLCHRCLFIFCPTITNEYLAQLYAEGYHGPEEEVHDRGGGEMDFLEPALRLLPKTENLVVLDYGTGKSTIAENLKTSIDKVVAIDIAPAVHAHPERLSDDLLKLQLEPDQFSLIFSFQAFEHLPQPRPVLDEFLRLAKPQGLILIHTDMETPERESEGFENWWYVAPPDHCVFYRHKTFEVYLELKEAELVYKDPKCVIIRKQR